MAADRAPLTPAAALAVLMRWPRLGEGKTRLAAQIGARAAHRLHTAFVADTLAWPAPGPRVLAVSPDNTAVRAARAAAPDALVVRQADGTLGARIADLLEAALACDGVDVAVLVGTDSPSLPERLLRACLDGARRCGAAMVPAEDGGFVAIAVSRTAATCSGLDWLRDDAIEWSTPDTAAQTVAAARRRGLQVRRTAPWYDVDALPDVRRLHDDLRAGRGRAPATLRCLDARAPGLAARVSAHALFWPCVAATAASAAFFAVAWLRYATYHSTAYDLAFFDQVVWNASQGNGMRSSFVAYPFLGQHFEPALWLLVPLYRLHATPLWLLGAQSLALGAAVVPLWALARRWLGGGARPAIVCAAYLLQIGVARALGFDFHTEALAVPFVFLALLGAARGSTATLLLAGVAPMLCKEDGALVTLGIAALALLVHRRRAAFALAGIAVAGGAVVVLAVMPHLRAGAPGDLVMRYAYLGETPGAILAHLVSQPGLWLGHLVSSPALPALLLALAAAGFLPLLRPAALAACLPALLLPLLAADPYQGALRLHYGLPATPLLVCAAMLGWQRVARRREPLAAGALVAGALATWLALSPLPGGHGPDRVRLDDLARTRSVDALLARIPADAPVAASGDLLTHLAERPVVSELPALGTATWVAVDAGAQTSTQSRDAGYTRAVHDLAARGWVRVATAGEVSLWRAPRG